MAYNDVELTFIRNILWEHGRYVWNLFQTALQQKNINNTGELKESIKYKLIKEGNNPGLSFSFLSYGRAIEIKYHSRNSRQFQMPNTNEVVWGIRNKPRSTRKKDTRWYAKTAYGSLNTLIGRLMTEASEQELARLKQLLEKPSN